jgi:hypothetical protein
MKVSGQLHLPAALPSEKEAPIPLVQEANVGTAASLDTVDERKISYLCWE